MPSASAFIKSRSCVKFFDTGIQFSLAKEMNSVTRNSN